MKGEREMPVSFKVTEEIRIEHQCKDCSYFVSSLKVTREASWREIIKDVFTLNQPIRVERVEGHKPFWCHKFKKSVNPQGAESCFEYSCSREIWLEYIHIFVGKDGKLKVKFEK